MNDYRYKLETPRVTGRRQQKYQCPHCGRKSLVRYVDTYDGCSYVADAVGKCDHQNSCGYHYKPSEYFRDNPWDQRHGDHEALPFTPPPPPSPCPRSCPTPPTARSGRAPLTTYTRRGCSAAR